MITFENIFQEIAVLLVLASAVSALLLWLRQPLIVAYILVGILAGPSVFGIIAAIGVSLGHIDTDALGLITLVGLITIGLSTYMILYSHPFYKRLASWLRIFEKRVPRREDTEGSNFKGTPVDVILFGVGRYGSNLVHNLTESGERVLGVDFDSEAVTLRNKQGLNVCYGDAADPECPSTLPLEHSKWVVSTIPQRDINLALLDALKHYT